MIKCRLKIICSNIINDIDIPEIKYISKNDNPKITYLNSEENMIKNDKNELEEENVNQSSNDNNNNNDLAKIKENNINKDNEKDEENIEQNNNNDIGQLEQIEELINYELANYNKLENDNSKLNDIKNIESNELYTISNQHIYDDNYFSGNISNYNTISHFYNKETKNNSLNTSDSKKNESNSSLKYIFKKRENKQYMNRSLSNKYSNNDKNKKYSLIKDIFKAHPVNYNYTNLKIINGNKNKNKVGNILNININKSFCINNNIKINQKNIIQNRSKNKTKKRSNENSLSKNKKYKNKNKIEVKKDDKDILKKVKPLKFNKKSNKNKLLNSLSNSEVSWNYVENSEMNIGQAIDYKMLIDELLTKEHELIKEKENMMKAYEEKIKPIKELNFKLINDNNEELDREDELRGELVILKNQHERLVSTMKNNKNKEQNNNVKEEKSDIENKNEEKIIEKEMKELDDKLNKGEILIITKPSNSINISELEEKNIILMLKGLFYTIHIRDTDEIVNLIWKKDKPMQTIYFLVKELLILFNLKDSERNLLINFFYSFCKTYNYMDITTFKKEFKAKIGNITLFNKKIMISKLMNFYRTEMIELIKIIKQKDPFNLGILTLDQINILLNNLGLFLEQKKDFDEIYEYIIIIMKKDRSFNLSRDNKINDDIEKESIIKYSLFDLFYESLIDLIEERDYNIISDPFELIRNYMQKNDINDVELLLKPLLKCKYIIKINNKEYFELALLNKFLRKLGIIQLNDLVDINCFEEELIDKDKFIKDINNYEINEIKEIDVKKINQNVNDLINGIFDNLN